MTRECAMPKVTYIRIQRGKGAPGRSLPVGRSVMRGSSRQQIPARIRLRGECAVRPLTPFYGRPAWARPRPAAGVPGSQGEHVEFCRDRRTQSRLSCQSRSREELDGMIVAHAGKGKH